MAEKKEMIFANLNGRDIGKPDIIFGISNRAKQMTERAGRDKVINATIGALMDDNGELMVLSSVSDTYKTLEPKDYCAYAPIKGTEGFRRAVIRDALGRYEPKGYVEAIATPGGTGSIRNTISIYSKPGDKIIAANWYWAPYRTLAQEQGRELVTFNFLKDGFFDIESFKRKLNGVLDEQDETVVIINTPAHNPTGYSLTLNDWHTVKHAFEEMPADKKITLLVDTAYIDFAGDQEKYREFLPVLEDMPGNVMVVIAHSLSKSYTLYGQRCGAMICLAKTEKLADEFAVCGEFVSRNTWSNCNRGPQEVLARIYADPELKRRVDEERAVFREMLLRRGKAFENSAKEAGLEMVPFDAGFFCSIPSDDPESVTSELEKEGIFLVPLAAGVRVSIASISEEKCAILPARIKAAIERVEERKAFEKAESERKMEAAAFLGVKTAADINRVMAEGKFRELVQLSEASHEKSIVEIAQKITESGKRLILIAGPSSSGKTTFAKKLCIQLRVNGLEPLYMGTDDYFVEREETPIDENGEKDFENLNAVDTALFNKDLTGLLDGEEVDLPSFDFLTGHKVFGKRITRIEENQPIVIEGIHALNDLLTSEIPMDEKFKIFICPIPVIRGGNDSAVDPVDYRMLRRMARDYKYRGYSAQNTIDNWPKVRAGEEKNIFPFADSADARFNTSHIYEIPILKKYTWSLLSNISPEEPEYNKAKEMLDFLRGFETYDDDSVVPNDSVLREFMGGSIYQEEEKVDEAKSKYRRWYQLRY